MIEILQVSPSFSVFSSQEGLFAMPVYTYRREDGTTFELRQSFNDAALTIDPASGQKVVRVIQGAGIIFKGSGFYVNDSKGASKATTTSVSKDNTAKSDSAPAAESGATSATPAAPTPAATPSPAAD